MRAGGASEKDGPVTQGTARKLLLTQGGRLGAGAGAPLRDGAVMRGRRGRGGGGAPLENTPIQLTSRAGLRGPQGAGGAGQEGGRL